MTKGLPAGWEVINSRYLHKEPWLTVRHDQLRLDDGHVIPKYYVLEYPDWVNVLGITDEGKFLLVSQYRHGTGNTALELCAGVMEEAETALDAAQRELLEETGYGGGQWEAWTTTAPNPATSNNMVYSFLATGLRFLSEPAPEASEKITVHLLDYDEMYQAISNGSMIQATHLVALWKYVALKSTLSLPKP